MSIRSLHHRKAALSSLLEDVVGAAFFRSFLEKDFSEAGLDFFDAATDVLRSDNAGGLNESDSFSTVSRKVIEEYVLPGAVHEVNLPSRCRIARRGTPERLALLRQAREEILLLLAFDPFPRFLQSSFFKAMVDEMSARGVLHRPVISDADAEAYTAGPSNVLSARMSSDAESVPDFQGEHATWLQRFMGIADVMPICITLAKVRSAFG